MTKLSYYKITQNFLSLLVGKSLELIISLLSITLIARNLGVEKYGLFISIIALTYIIGKVTDLGFAPIVFREKSKAIQSYSLINTSLTLRLISFISLILIFNLISPHTNLTDSEIIYSNVLLLNIIFSAKYMNFRELFEIKFKVNHNMLFVMVLNTIDSIFLLIFALMIPIVKPKLEFIVFGYVLSNLPGFIGMLIYLKKRYHFIFRFSLYQTRWLIKESLPLYGTVLFTAIFQQVDVLFLRSLDTTYATGIYGAATRLASPLNIIPIALITTVFPILVRYAEQKESLSSSIKLSVLVYKILFFFAFSLSFIVTFKAQDLIIIILGTEYYQAHIPLIILFWSFIFVYFNTFSQNILTANNLQKYNFYFTLILVVSNFLLLVLLTSKYSFVGASIAKVTASLIGSGFLFIILKKISIEYNFLSLEIIIWIISIGILVFICSFLPVYFYLLLLLITIPLLTWKLNYFSNEELTFILKLVANKNWKEKIQKHI